MNNILVFLLLAACCPPAAAQQPDAPPAVSSAAPAPGSYDYGMLQYRQGDHAGAKETFVSLLIADPAGTGALEGLGLACLALGQYEEAAVYLEKWNARSPGKPYILGLLRRAQAGSGDERGALRTNRELAGLDPRDCAARQRAETGAERAGSAVFPKARAYRSVSLEDLDTANPQRIIYEGSSAGARFRAPLAGGLDLIGGADLRTDAQRNDGRGFTYFEIQEQAYTAGLTGRQGGRARWEAEAGQSVFTEVSGPGTAPLAMGRGRLSLRGAASGLDLSSQPKLLRVAGGGRFYRLLRESTARAEAEGVLLGLDLLGRAGFSNLSGGRTLGNLYLRGLRDLGWSAGAASYSHGQQEFYSGSASGRLRYVHTDRLGASVTRLAQGAYRASASAYQTYYSDSNRLLDTGAELTAWLPWQKEFSAGYRYANLDFRRAYSGYDNVDETGHWLGAGWRRCAGRNWSAAAGYEHGYITDSLLSYHADVYTAEVEWYSDRGSLGFAAKRKTTVGRGHSWSAGLQARYSFK